MPACIRTYCARSRRTAQTLAICALSVALAVLTLAVGQNATELRGGSVEAQGLGGVTVTGVAADHSSARIYYQPVVGARDYRVYDTVNPMDVKYAGMVHLTASAACPGSYCQDHFVVQSDGKTPVFPYQVASGGSGGPQGLDVAASDIEWNGLGVGNAHTLVVEAVDQLGPAPHANLYTGVDNMPLLSGGMLGSNKGSTGDGNVSTNGQGPYTNTPHAIARSQPFVVQANRSVVPIPSSSGASQTFLDTFENAEGASIHQVLRNDTSTDAFGNLGQMTYTMNAGTSKAWTIEYRQANNRDSMPFIASDHFMDMLFDGATPNTSAPTHTIYGSMSMTPGQTVSMANGQIVHLTMEVDAHQSFRRWLAFDIAPASDPLQGWDPNTYPINNSNQGIFLELKNNFCTMDIFTGPNGSKSVPTGTAGGSHGARLWGQAGSSGGGAVMCDTDGMYNPATLSYDGRGLDDRSRLDFFISQTHAALFEDGRLVVQSDIPVGTFPFANQPLKVYFSHYLYHSDADVSDLETVELNGAGLCYAENSYWFNAPTSGTASNQDVCNASYPAGYGFPYSDERHWDNMGFEALPSSSTSASDYSGLSSKVQPPQPQAPQFTGSTSATNTPTATAVPPTNTSTPSSTATPPPTATSVPPTATSVPPTAVPANGGGSVGQWVNVTPSNVNLTSNLDCDNYGVQTVVSDPARASDLYAAFDCQGIWKSTNYGQSWTGPINTGPNGAVAGDCAGGIAIARGGAGQPPILYESCIRGSGTGFWRSTDGGVSWARFTVGPG